MKGGGGHGGSSKVSLCDAYDGRLSDADVSAVIYQWKHADTPVVLHSLQWMHSILTQSCALSPASLDRLVLALIEAVHASNAVRDSVLALFSALLSTPSPTPHLRNHMTSASFPHTAALLTLLLSIYHTVVSAGDVKSKNTIESLWSQCLALYRPTVLTSLVSLLGSTAPSHRECLTLVLLSLHGVVIAVSATVLTAVMAGLSAQLTVLLGHEHVLIRKHAVKVWVCVWEVIGEAVEPYLVGMSGVSRKLVDIYLRKAREERTAQKG